MPCKVDAKLHFGKWHDIEVEDDVTATFRYDRVPSIKKILDFIKQGKPGGAKKKGDLADESAEELGEI